MGAISFVEEGTGKNVKEVFQSITERLLYESGHKRYNGTMSTCGLGKCTLRLKGDSKTNIKKAYKHIEKMNDGRKWSADYIEFGTVGYKVVTVKKIKNSKNPVYRMKYIVTKGFLGNEKMKSFDKIGDANKYAESLALKNPDDNYYIEKGYELIKGDKQVTEFKIEEKFYKKEPKLKFKANRRIIPVKKFMFYGKASS
jgi:hypothetical protein